jgi:hypothetical protein
MMFRHSQSTSASAMTRWMANSATSWSMLAKKLLTSAWTK